MFGQDSEGRSTVWWELAQCPGRKVVLDLGTYIHIVKTTRTEAECRAKIFTHGTITAMTQADREEVEHCWQGAKWHAAAGRP